MKNTTSMGSDADRRVNIGQYTTVVAAKITAFSNDEYVIKNWLYRDSLAMIYGASNSGKSFLAVDIGMHVAYGDSWNTCRTKNGLVLYVAAEGAGGIAKRIAAFQRGKSRENWAFHIIRESPNFASDDNDAIRVVNTCALLESRHSMAVSLIIIDTLAATAGGADENSSSEMGKLMENMRLIQNDTGACVLMIHHSGKDHTRGARGSSAIRAAVDTEIEVRAGKDGDALLHAARVTKQRDADRESDFNFVLKQVHLADDEDGDKITSCVVKSTETICPEHDSADSTGYPKIVRMTDLQKLALEAFDAELKISGNDGALGTIMWRDAFRMLVNEKLGYEPNKYQWRDTRNALQKKDFVSYNKNENSFSLT